MKKTVYLGSATLKLFVLTLVLMTARSKPAQTFTLEAGHSPFLSQPKKLVKILKKAAKS